MSNFDKPEEEPAPAPAPSQSQEFSDCSYICFYIDQSIYEKEGFVISSSLITNLGVQEFRLDNNLVVFCIHCGGLLNMAFKLFKSTYYFKISYKFKNSPIFTCNFDFTVEKGKIKYSVVSECRALEDAGEYYIENAVKSGKLGKRGALQDFFPDPPLKTAVPLL